MHRPYVLLTVKLQQKKTDIRLMILWLQHMVNIFGPFSFLSTQKKVTTKENGYWAYRWSIDCSVEWLKFWPTFYILTNITHSPSPTTRHSAPIPNYNPIWPLFARNPHLDSGEHFLIFFTLELDLCWETRGFQTFLDLKNMYKLFDFEQMTIISTWNNAFWRWIFTLNEI